jgi:hypothetical protein
MTRTRSSFLTATGKNIWNTTQHISQSNRTQKVDKLFKKTPVYDTFSQNTHLDFYKTNLVQTGNVDHIIPFKHSQK